MDILDLRRRVSGEVVHREDASYEELRRSLVWNGLKTARRPEVVVRAAHEPDVVEAVRFARANGLQVAVRGGGHNWVGFSQRDRGLLLDVSALTAVSVDVGSRTAAVGPGVRSQDLDRLLSAEGLAFPVGHCATVPMSGFLLNGGLGWNTNAWRPACFSVSSARVVTAAGTVVVAGEEDDRDLLWAVRGAGPGFFGVVTEYRLRLYPEPRRITSNTYYHRMSDVDGLATWFEEAVHRLPEQVEVSFFMQPAPPDLAAAAEPDNGYVCVLGATAFVDSPDEARSVMSVLDESPVLADCLRVERDQATPIDALLRPSLAAWPEGLRYLADTAWSDSPAEVVRRSRDHHLRAPSRRSFATTWFSTGPRGIASRHPDAAFSLTGRTLTLSYAIWDDEAQDEANHLWHRTMVDDLHEVSTGHYIAEVDIVRHPERHERSFKPENWKRLHELRQRYDPESLFHGPYTDGEAG
ncbi:FAD-binding oxidoreductase [Saccharothrix australiensis]|uniref:FAD/FMN-containing dehydrogenase n=1 Tax=Saccharothrix australiensis TaxID=2072 RepID=A0A495W3U9_9PSEU|nr:FAD-binding oxidoreductase [Saccharothrix australiensis]RKT55717.1 FAD/FMN-containing dehydrogenase [Saccharothrix australiensis]